MEAVSPLGIQLLELLKEEISISDPIGEDPEHSSKFAFAEKRVLSSRGAVIREALVP